MRLDVLLCPCHTYTLSARLSGVCVGGVGCTQTSHSFARPPQSSCILAAPTTRPQRNAVVWSPPQRHAVAFDLNPAADDGCRSQTPTHTHTRTHTRTMHTTQCCVLVDNCACCTSSIVAAARVKLRVRVVRARRSRACSADTQLWQKRRASGCGRPLSCTSCV